MYKAKDNKCSESKCIISLVKLKLNALSIVLWLFVYAAMQDRYYTLDFSSLLKNHFECSFVSSECSLQSEL